MRQHKTRRGALLALAIAFLAVAWVWDRIVGVGARVARIVPWARFKQGFARIIDWLPTPLVLLVFIVPFLIVEPLLVVATIAIAMGYVVLGVVGWIILKLLAVALIPAIFDLTKHRLMTMPWFARAYEKVVAIHDWADGLVAPYKEAATAALRQWRRKVATLAGGGPSLTQRAARIAARKRAGGGRPPIAEKG